jgi:hypothetical protein
MAKKSNPKSEALLVPARCPKCGGELGKVSTGRFECRYCGTTFLPGEVFGGKAVDLQKFYERALAAVEEGNYGRANEYFERILETDAAEYQAWVGKGIAGAYARLAESQMLEAGEVLSCVDMALEYYDGDDKAAFQQTLGDRVGALAVDLFERVKEEGANDEKNLRALLDLLGYWEAKGTDEMECWLATVAVAEQQAVPPKAKRRPGVTYLTFNYPFKNVAKKYAQKIRAKYDAEFTNVFERGADAQAEITRSLKRFGKILIIALGVAVGLGVLFVLVLIILAALGYTYFT